MNPTKAAAILAVMVFFAACTHRASDIQVSYSHGWDTGEIKTCERASGTSVTPDSRGEVLLCDSDSQVAWIQSHRDAVYEVARMYSVVFLTSGKDEPWVSGRGHDTFWQCKKTTSDIECR
jgi:hypothetical protein